MKPKGNGQSIMVSQFVTERDGALRRVKDTGETEYAVETLYPGTNRQGWWTIELMLEQTQKAMRIFEDSFPGCVGVFMFDCSSAHEAFAPDALRASVMNKSDGGEQPLLRDGYYAVRDTQSGQSVIVPQQMWYWADGEEDDPQNPGQKVKVKVAKGIKSVLQERGLWDTVARLKLTHPNTPCDGTGMCCLRAYMDSQPDFVAQTNRLTEAVTARGHVPVFFPKFHCELSFIELYWGAIKRLARKECDYKFQGLKDRLPGLLSSGVPVPLMRKFANKCWRYMDYYRLRVQYAEVVRLEKERRTERRASHRRAKEASQPVPTLVVPREHH